MNDLEVWVPKLTLAYNIILQELEELKVLVAKQKTEIFELKNIIDNLPGDIYWKNKEGVYSGLNITGRKSLERMGFILEKDEVIGKTDYDLYSQETADKFRENDLSVMHSKIEMTREESAILPSGEEITQLSTKRPLWDEKGNIIGIVGNTLDITELKKAKEKAEVANEAKASFLRNMRHDLRTPFSGILTLAQLMADDETDLEKRTNLQHIADSATVLLTYMNTILDHAQLGTDARAIAKNPVHLQKLLHESLLTITPTAVAKHLRLHEHYADNVPHIILSDAWRLKRIIINLLSNAVKFTDSGDVSIGVDVISETADQITLAIWVKDTGIGIPENKYNDIFEKFTRLEMAYSGKYGGTGLGLYDVKQLCYDLDGYITIKSELNKGSLFTCTFPFAKVNTLINEIDDIEQQTEGQSNLQMVNNVSVLLVEDQPIAVMSATRMLRAHGYLVDSAETGYSALEKFTDKKYDIILMDIGLPDIDGIQVTHKIRQLETANKIAKTPIIAVTAHPDGSENELNIFDKVCDKPFSPAVLEQMNNILNAKS